MQGRIPSFFCHDCALLLQAAGVHIYYNSAVLDFTGGENRKFAFYLYHLLLYVWYVVYIITRTSSMMIGEREGVGCGGGFVTKSAKQK